MNRPARWLTPALPRLIALGASLLLSGCITVDVGGGGQRDMRETVIQGKSGPKILLLDIDGEITDSDASGVLGWVLSEGTVARVQDELTLAERKGDIEAILLRIDSPGGSPTASDSVYRLLKEFKKKYNTPIYAQYLSVAASGGYYLSMAADQIVASPTTITGSIGVVMFGVSFSGLMEKVGIANQTITSGPFKDAGSWLKPMDPAERKQLQSVVDDLYDRFLTVVEAGRPNLKPARVRELADGRIYSAPQAKKNGLVDKIGYLEETIESIRTHLGAEQIRVVNYSRSRNPPANIYARTSINAPIEIEPEIAARVLPKPGFYYLWCPASP